MKYNKKIIIFLYLHENYTNSNDNNSGLNWLITSLWNSFLDNFDSSIFESIIYN